MKARKSGKALDESEIGAVLESLEDNARDYVHGPLAEARALALQEYYQKLYPGDDPEDGLSKFVTSDVQDTIEWILPTLLRMFIASGDAVEFEARRAEDEAQAMQATTGCNYVFYTQNNGVLLLTEAFKDALMLRGAPVTWRWEDEDIIDRRRMKALTALEIAYSVAQLEQEGEVEIDGHEVVSEGVLDELGNVLDEPRFDVSLSIHKTRGKVTVETVAPEKLLIFSNWKTPLLDKCPYVAIEDDEVTLSDLKRMGYDFDEDELTEDYTDSYDRDARNELSGDFSENRREHADKSMRTVRLMREWVLIDADGDGVAERRYIVRVGKKIFENEITDHVPVANGIPILRPHRWDGMSMADVMASLQEMKTELTRMMLNSAYFSVLPETQVLTDSTGVPLVNVDDLLSPKPGGIKRVKQIGALQPFERNFSGVNLLPVIQYVDGMAQNRSGIGQYFTGGSENALNKTAQGTNQLITQAQQRVDLIARMLAETLVAPMFRGIFRLLSLHQSEPMMFKLSGEFVEFDPSEWRDQFDMVINVGIGNNSKDQTLGHLMQIGGMLQQFSGVTGQNGPMVSPRSFFELIKRTTNNMGIKQPDLFVSDPGDPVQPQQPGPPPEIVKTQMTLERDREEQQKDIEFELEKQRRDQLFKAQTQIHSDEVSFGRERLGHEREDFREQSQGVEQEAQHGDMKSLIQALTQAVQALAKPRLVQLVRDANGRTIGAEDAPEPDQAQPDPVD